MILKVLKGSSWELFDNFDRVGYKDLEGDKPLTTYSNCFDFTEFQKSFVSETNKKVEILLWRNGDIVGQVISYQLAFILNNNGSTIDRI